MWYIAKCQLEKLFESWCHYVNGKGNIFFHINKILSISDSDDKIKVMTASFTRY